MTSGDRRDTIVRYSAAERTTHWLVALSFILVALSGLALFHPALFWFSNLFGGGAWTRILHPFIGLFMALVFLSLAGTVWDDNRMQRADWQGLRQLQDEISNPAAQPPEFGRYNAGQKLLFFVIVACMAGLVLSGLVIWRAYFASYFSLGMIRLAAVLHAICAVVLICAILVHIYAALWVKGSMHAMMRGTVTPGWAWKHHRAWYRQITHAANPRSGPD